MRTSFRHQLAVLCGRLALAAALAGASAAASAGVIHVTIDTANFGVSNGFIDMNLSASGGVPLETATVNHLVGFDSVTSVDSWGVTTIPGGYVFRNDTPNDLFQGLAFGGVLSFDLSFDGAVDPLTVYKSAFVVSAYAPDGFTPLGKYDPFTGGLAEFTWTPARAAGQNGTVGITVLDTSAVTAVPEPGELMLMGVSFAVMALARRRANRAALPA